MHAGTKSYNASFNKEKQQIQIGNLIISRKKKKMEAKICKNYIQIMTLKSKIQISKLI